MRIMNCFVCTKCEKPCNVERKLVQLVASLLPLEWSQCCEAPVKVVNSRTPKATGE